MLLVPALITKFNEILFMSFKTAVPGAPFINIQDASGEADP